LIIGLPGAGKTTLAKDIAAQQSLAVEHLDQVIFGEGWTPRPEQDVKAKVAAIVKKDAWVVEGLSATIRSYQMDDLMVAADKIYYLDGPALVRAKRIASRMKSHVLGREDLPGHENGNRYGLNKATTAHITRIMLKLNQHMNGLPGENSFVFGAQVGYCPNFRAIYGQRQMTQLRKELGLIDIVSTNYPLLPEKTDRQAVR